MRLLVPFCLLAVNSLLCAQAVPSARDVAIDRAKNVIVSTIDRGLPQVTLKFFLSYEAGGGPIRWSAYECGKEVPDVRKTAGSETPICIEASFASGNRSVEIAIDTGSGERRPSLIKAAVIEMDGSIRAMRQLGDLPMALHRPAPMLPRDLGPQQAAVRTIVSSE